MVQRHYFPNTKLAGSNTKLAGSCPAFSLLCICPSDAILSSEPGIFFIIKRPSHERVISIVIPIPAFN